jgi:hypothetical protein
MIAMLGMKRRSMRRIKPCLPTLALMTVSFISISPRIMRRIEVNIPFQRSASPASVGRK